MIIKSALNIEISFNYYLIGKVILINTNIYIDVLINARKHGISFQESLTVFKDTLSLTYPDVDHSDDENRFLIIGRSSSGNVLVISHTFRTDSIRIINARKATKKERFFYENEARH